MSGIESRELLAKNHSSQIEVCNKGIVHVQSGPVTLHLSFEQAKDLATSLEIAMIRLTSLTEFADTSILRLVQIPGEKNG